MFKFIFAIVALLAVGGTAAGAAVYLTNSGGTAEDVPPPAVVQTSPEPSPGVTTAAPVTAETPAPAMTSTPAGWVTYTDPDFGFSMDYPPEFVWDDTVFGSLPRGMLKFVRFVDKQFASDYPPGQVTIFVFARDGDTPAEWIFKHAAEGAPPTDVESKQLYFFNVTNVSSVTVAGRSAVAFDWAIEGEGGGVLHDVAFFSGPRVMVIGWEAGEPSYAAIAQSTFNRMIATYRE